MKKAIAVLFAVIMVAFATIPAFAAEVNSPVATTAPDSSLEYEVDIIPTEGGDGTYEFVTEIDENGNQVVSISPKPNPGYTFNHLEIDGPYTTENELTDAQMRLIITGDITVTPYFEKSGTVATGTVSTDTSTTSPQTGANDALPYAVGVLSLLACGAAVAMLVRTNKSK